MPKRSHKQPDEVQAVISGSNIRIQPVKSPRGKTSAAKVITSAAHEIRPKSVTGFLDFLREHAVVGLIIGFVLGTQVQSLVKQLVQSFINPLSQLLFSTAISQKAFMLHFHGRTASFGWGAFVYALIIFLFVLLSIYILIKGLRLDKFDKKDN